MSPRVACVKVCSQGGDTGKCCGLLRDKSRILLKSDREGFLKGNVGPCWFSLYFPTRCEPSFSFGLLLWCPQSSGAVWSWTRISKTVNLISLFFISSLPLVFCCSEVKLPNTQGNPSEIMAIWVSLVAVGMVYMEKFQILWKCGVGSLGGLSEAGGRRASYCWGLDLGNS